MLPGHNVLQDSVWTLLTNTARRLGQLVGTLPVLVYDNAGRVASCDCCQQVQTINGHGIARALQMAALAA